MTGRQEFVIVCSMLFRSWRNRVKQFAKHGFGQIEFKTRGRRTQRMRSAKPHRPAMIQRCPEFARSIPDGGLLLIDTVDEQIVRAGLVGSMMEANRPFRTSFVGLKG